MLALSWNLKVYLHPLPARDFNAFIERATVGILPGWGVFVVGVIFNVAIAIFAIGTLRLREATGEVLPQHQFSLRPLQTMTRGLELPPAHTYGAAREACTPTREKRSRPGEFRKIDLSETPDRKQNSEFKESELRTQDSGVKG